MEKITLTEKRFFEWHEDDRSVTLRNHGGSYGGGSEVLIITSSPVIIPGEASENYIGKCKKSATNSEELHRQV